MKIKRFNKTNVMNREPGTSSVYIHNAGNFCFNEPAAKKLGAIDPSVTYYIEIIQDEESPKDWYVTLSTEEVGIRFRKEKSSDKYNINSGVIAKQILAVLPKSEAATSPTTATLLIGATSVEEEGLTLWPIITSSFKSKK